MIGHKSQWQFLRNSAKLGKLPHAFLFLGPSKLGKKTLALELAKFLNCQDKKDEKKPCHRCYACGAIEKLQYPDVIFIRSEGKEISIDQVRHLNWQMSLKPYSAKIKLAILDDAHNLNQEAQNCLLKTFEEPRADSILILITEYPARLLATIHSRAQKIRFFPVALEEIRSYLLSAKTSVQKAEEIAVFVDGRPGAAVELLQNEEVLNFYRQRVKEVEGLFSQNLGSRFQYAKSLSEKNLLEINQTFQIWLRFFHGIFLGLARKSGPLQISEKLKNLPLAHIQKIIQQIETTQTLINFTNVNTKLALENFLLQL